MSTSTDVSAGLAEEVAQMRRELAAMQAGFEQRLSAIEARVGELSEAVRAQAEHSRRTLEMRTARSGELSSRIAQRIAKLETAVELLARCDDSETADRI